MAARLRSESPVGPTVSGGADAGAGEGGVSPAAAVGGGAAEGWDAAWGAATGGGNGRRGRRLGRGQRAAPARQLAAARRRSGPGPRLGAVQVPEGMPQAQRYAARCPCRTTARLRSPGSRTRGRRGRPAGSTIAARLAARLLRAEALSDSKLDRRLRGQEFGPARPHSGASRVAQARPGPPPGAHTAEPHCRHAPVRRDRRPGPRPPAPPCARSLSARPAVPTTRRSAVRPLPARSARPPARSAGKARRDRPERRPARSWPMLMIAASGPIIDSSSASSGRARQQQAALPTSAIRCITASPSWSASSSTVMRLVNPFCRRLLRDVRDFMQQRGLADAIRPEDRDNFLPPSIAAIALSSVDLQARCATIGVRGVPSANRA